ncbi:MAG: transglycosylase SLT domain-containing protein [Thermanaerothrix sp.]|nr:transglycosylase SLT domain-containing protein [Thermanaerothrix sp.]
MSRTKYIAYTIEQARKQGIPPEILTGLIQIESGYNPNAVGDGGKAVGIAQIWPETAKELGLENRYDPFASIEAAATYLKKQYQRLGDWRKAVDAYQGVRKSPSRFDKIVAEGKKILGEEKKEESGIWDFEKGVKKVLEDIVNAIPILREAKEKTEPVRKVLEVDEKKIGQWAMILGAWLLVGLLIFLGIWAMVNER